MRKLLHGIKSEGIIFNFDCVVMKEQNGTEHRQCSKGPYYTKKASLFHFGERILLL